MRLMRELMFLQHQIIWQIISIFLLFSRPEKYCTHEEGQHAVRPAVCLRWAVRCLQLYLLKRAWPLNIIKLAWVLLLRSTCIHTHTHLSQIEVGIQLSPTNTHTHKPFPQREAKSIPNTPHRSYLHGFDVSLRLSGDDNVSLPSAQLGHTHAHANRQILTNDAHTRNTRCRCAHTHEAQATVLLPVI